MYAAERAVPEVLGSRNRALLTQARGEALSNSDKLMSFDIQRCICTNLSIGLSMYEPHKNGKSSLEFTNRNIEVLGSILGKESERKTKV